MGSGTGESLLRRQPQASEVKLISIYRRIIPPLVVPLFFIVLMFLFPGLALWAAEIALGLNAARRAIASGRPVCLAAPGQSRAPTRAGERKRLENKGLRCGWGRAVSHPKATKIAGRGENPGKFVAGSGLRPRSGDICATVTWK